MVDVAKPTYDPVHKLCLNDIFGQALNLKCIIIIMVIIIIIIISLGIVLRFQVILCFFFPKSSGFAKHDIFELLISLEMIFLGTTEHFSETKYIQQSRR